MNPTPSHHKPVYYTPGCLLPKILYLALGVGILLLGFGYLWEPLGRCLYGKITDANVVRIVRTQPGSPDTVYTFRQEFPEENSWSVVFQHYVAVEQQGKTVLLHIGVDTHHQPNYNINDRISVCYYPGDAVAFDVWNLRSWGIGIFITLIGSIIAMNGVFLVWNANRPILLDHESEEFTQALDEGHPPSAEPDDPLQK